MTHFPVSYAGNKRNEYKHIKEFINLDDTKYIIEPFCGSCAISFNIWLEHGDRFKYYLSDNDPFIINLLRLLKNEETENVTYNMTKSMQIVKDKNDFLILKDTNNKTIYEELTYHKYSTFRLGLFNFNKKPIFKLSKLQYKFIEFIKSSYVNIVMADWFKLFDKFKDKKAVFIMDPPYLMSCNTFYSSNHTLNVYDYFSVNDVKKYNSKIYFILEDNWIIKLLFKDLNFISYDKHYEISKKKTKHLIISNKL